MIIAGDIGGTHTRLVCVEMTNSKTQTIAKQVYKSEEYSGLEQIIDKFLSENMIDEDIAAICLGIAGPVKAGEVAVTNLPWHVSENGLKKKYAINQVALLNDFAAIAYAIPSFDSNDILTLQQGVNEASQSVAIVGAGTGLGSCHVIIENNVIKPLTSEAGHCSFTPENNLQCELLQWMWQKNKFVSVESLVSGRGIFSLYQFLKYKEVAVENNRVADKFEQHDPARVISEHANEDELCRLAIELFVEIYAAAIRNIILHYYPLSSIYIAGGIALKIRRFMESTKFIESFTNNDAMQDNLKSITINLILDENPGLKGVLSYCRLNYDVTGAERIEC